MSHEICLLCKIQIGKPAAYITGALLPVCSNCLDSLVEEYSWEKDDGSPHKVQRRKLKPLALKSWNEVSHELEFYMSSIPSITETEDNFVEKTITKLGRSTEIRRIPLLLEI